MPSIEPGHDPNPEIADLVAKRAASSAKFYERFNVRPPGGDLTPGRRLPGGSNGDFWLHDGYTSMRVRRDGPRVLLDIEVDGELLKRMDINLAAADELARELLRITDER